MSKKANEPSERLKECVLNWLEKLAKHFGVELDEDQVKIFVHALRNNTTYQVDIAFDRCLNECQFMPKLREVHERIPEQKWAPENPSAFITYGPNTLDLVRPIAREICPEVDRLEGAELRDVFFRANRLRYERMGIDTSKWGQVK